LSKGTHSRFYLMSGLETADHGRMHVLLLEVLAWDSGPGVILLECVLLLLKCVFVLLECVLFVLSPDQRA
jgi:hypothetical protein